MPFARAIRGCEAELKGLLLVLPGSACKIPSVRLSRAIMIGRPQQWGRHCVFQTETCCDFLCSHCSTVAACRIRNLKSLLKKASATELKDGHLLQILCGLAIPVCSITSKGAVANAVHTAALPLYHLIPQVPWQPHKHAGSSTFSHECLQLAVLHRHISSG